MGKVKSVLFVGDKLGGDPSGEDYDFLAWENKNFAEYLKKALGFDQETIDLIAQGGLPMLKKFEEWLGENYEIK